MLFGHQKSSLNIDVLGTMKIALQGWTSATPPTEQLPVGPLAHNLGVCKPVHLVASKSTGLSCLGKWRNITVIFHSLLSHAQTRTHKPCLHLVLKLVLGGGVTSGLLRCVALHACICRTSSLCLCLPCPAEHSYVHILLLPVSFLLECRTALCTVIMTSFSGTHRNALAH